MSIGKRMVWYHSPDAGRNLEMGHVSEREITQCSVRIPNGENDQNDLHYSFTSDPNNTNVTR